MRWARILIACVWRCIMKLMNLNISLSLKKLRLRAGLSLSQLARRANTSPATLSRYENGWHRFELYTLRKLASALGYCLRIELEPLSRAGTPEPISSAVKQLQRLFWDRILEEGDFYIYPAWLTRRVLEYGSFPDVQILVNVLGRRRFLEQVSKIKFTSARTERFWQQILEREGLQCTKKYSQTAAESYWPG